MTLLSSLQEFLDHPRKGEVSKIHLASSDIGDKGAADLARALPEAGRLKELDLRSNNIGPEGALALGAALSFLAELEMLRLDDNNVGPKGAVALGGALRSAAKLKTLRIRNNGVKSEGAVALAGALSSALDLEWPDLSKNGIGDEGAVALAGALSSATRLQKLHLNDNNIGTHGAMVLAGALSSATRLKKLGFSGNPADDRSSRLLMGCTSGRGREAAAREAAAHGAGSGSAADDEAAREKAAREQAAREQAAREQAAREQAAREQAAREQAAREEAARQKAAAEQRAAEKPASGTSVGGKSAQEKPAEGKQGSSTMAKAQDYAGTAIKVFSGIETGLATAGVVFPPLEAAAALVNVFKLCLEIKKTYDDQRRFIDTTLPNLLERVDALQAACKDLERLRILGKEPTGLVQLLGSAHALCVNCLQKDATNQKTRFSKFRSAATDYFTKGVQKREQAFEVMHGHLSRAVGDITFIVQVRHFEADQATAAQAQEQRLALMQQLVSVEDFSRRMYQDMRAESAMRAEALKQLQQTHEAAFRQAQANGTGIASVGENVDGMRAQMEEMRAEMKALIQGLQAGTIDQGQNRLTDEEAESIKLRAGIPPHMVRPWADLRSFDDSSVELDTTSPANLVGKGGFGIVFRAWQRSFGGSFVDVAVKVLDVDWLSTRDVEAMKKEVGMQLQCGGHPNVLSIRYLVLDNEHHRYAIVMDYCATDLHNVVHNDTVVEPSVASMPAWKWSTLNLRDRLKKLMGVVQAVVHMHELRVTHNDLKPANVLVESGMSRFLVTDFGMAKTMATTTAGQGSKLLTGHREAAQAEGDDEMGGTLPYMAPELFRSPKPRSESDVYALAILLYECLDGCPPLRIRTQTEAIQMVLKDGMRPDTSDLEEKCAEEGLGGLVPLLQRGWAQNRRDRPSARELHEQLLEMAYGPPMAAGAGAGIATAPSGGPKPAASATSGASTPSVQLSTGHISQAVQYLAETQEAQWTLEGMFEAMRLGSVLGALKEEGVEDVRDVLDVDMEVLSDVGAKKVQVKKFQREQDALRVFFAEKA